MPFIVSVVPSRQCACLFIYLFVLSTTQTYGSLISPPSGKLLPNQLGHEDCNKSLPHKTTSYDDNSSERDPVQRPSTLTPLKSRDDDSYSATFETHSRLDNDAVSSHAVSAAAAENREGNQL